VNKAQLNIKLVFFVLERFTTLLSNADDDLIVSSKKNTCGLKTNSTCRSTDHGSIILLKLFCSAYNQPLLIGTEPNKNSVFDTATSSQYLFGFLSFYS